MRGRRCRDCGFPRRLSRFLEWHSDGTVIGSVRPRIPVMFLEVDEWDSIFDGLARTIGFPIEHIVVEAQKNIGKDLYDMVKGVYWNINVKRIPSNRFFRPQWLGKSLIWGMKTDLAGLGAGRPSLVSLKAGDSMVLRFSDPCLVPMIVGNCLGIYESLEEMPGSSADYKIEDGDLVVSMRHAEEKPVASERLFLEEVEAGTGPLSYERCKRCGVPLQIARSLSWDLSRGIISNPLTSRRESMIAVQSVNAILRELERELGDEIPGIVYDAEKTYAAEELAETDAAGDGFWDEYLEGLALRGLGYPDIFEKTGNSIRVDIQNAYNQDLYAAKIVAGLEAATGRPSSISWETRERKHGVYRVTAGP